MDTNLLEVAGSSETAHTLTTGDHLDSISILLFECHTEVVPGFHTNSYLG